MANKLPVLSTVLYGTEERRKNNKPNAAPRLPTLKDLCTPQTRHLFTINYNIITMPQRPMSR
jgi:hypothetical protein